MDVDSIFSISVFLIVIGVFVIFFSILKAIQKKNRISHDSSASNQTTLTEPPNGPRTVQSVPADIKQANIPYGNRKFSLKELRQAEDGKYNWDETGCVFEVNNDGTVTLVGSFDPAELLVDPVDELYDSLVEDSLLEMLPHIWSFVTHRVHETGAYFVHGDAILYTDDYIVKEDTVKEAVFTSSAPIADVPSLVRLICKEMKGYLFLLPVNEKEFLFALGAQACLRRHIPEGLNIRISSPATMGALWTGVLRNSNKTCRISYAFGNESYYQCCNMTVGDGVYQVNQLLPSSIIQPANMISAIDKISHGCLLYSRVLYGDVKDVLLLDALSYPISLMEIENGRVVKIYDLITGTVGIPTKQIIKDLTITHEKKLLLVLGTSVLIDDVASTMEIIETITSVQIEIDANSSVTFLAKTPFVEKSIDLGSLIG